ncbi:hypothetical protein SLE2022_249960 [Rubroshorea leprosula]
MGFFKFVMICFDALAWPILALGYPLAASIQAIETNSDTDCRKLVTYWVLFSLISLFEYAFMDLLEWVSDWPYVKLLMVCWLMIPRFDGAFHVYNNFIHPCLYVDLQTIIKDLFAKRENFLKEAEKRVKAYGFDFEALEKLISSSKSEGNGPGIKQKDSENAYPSAASPALQVNGKKVVVTAVKQIPKAEVNGFWANNKIPVEIKEAANPSIPTFQQVQKTWIPKAELNVDKNSIKILPPVEFKAAANPGMSTLQQVQKEWNCAMCQVIVSSEIELKSHLQGSQHNATCEELMKAKNQASKSRFSAPSASYDFKTPRKEPEKCAYGSRTTHQESNKPNGVWQAEIENTFVEVKNSKYLCSVCNISCTSYGDLVSHLDGKKHLSHVRNC